ncbi:MAG TPA: hypothetical protein VGA70_00850 [Longimicrobiales bacterium]
MLPSRLSALTGLALALLAPVGGAAQDAPDLPAGGDWSISLALFENDDSQLFGVAYMLMDRLELGVEAEISHRDTEWTVSGSSFAEVAVARASASVGPVIRWYLNRTRVVSPYVRGKIAYGWGGAHLNLGGARQSEEDYVVVEGSLAVGAEWNPLHWLGVGGHTGLTYFHSDLDELNSQSGSRIDETDWGVQTFRSGIHVKLYFR